MVHTRHFVCVNITIDWWGVAVPFVPLCGDVVVFVCGRDVVYVVTRCCFEVFFVAIVVGMTVVDSSQSVTPK